MFEYFCDFTITFNNRLSGFSLTQFFLHISKAFHSFVCLFRTGLNKKCGLLFCKNTGYEEHFFHLLSTISHGGVIDKLVIGALLYRVFDFVVIRFCFQT